MLKQPIKAEIKIKKQSQIKIFICDCSQFVSDDPALG